MPFEQLLFLIALTVHAARKFFSKSAAAIIFTWTIIYLFMQNGTKRLCKTDRDDCDELNQSSSVSSLAHTLAHTSCNVLMIDIILPANCKTLAVQCCLRNPVWKKWHPMLALPYNGISIKGPDCVSEVHICDGQLPLNANQQSIQWKQTIARMHRIAANEAKYEHFSVFFQHILCVSSHT